MTPSYEQYSVREFVTDSFFIDWVKYPDDKSDAFWREWLIDYPHKQEDIQQARAVVLQLARQTDVVAQHELDQDWETIQKRISRSDDRDTGTIIRPLWQRQWAWTAVAAAVLLVLSISIWPRLTSSVRKGNPTATQSLSAFSILNRTQQVVAQRLPDGSVVWMTPGARLSYPRQFAANNRTVQFMGEGFFDVAKDASRPFIIHSGQLKTQVLGTSFNVKANTASDTYAVSVVTGKVSVSARMKNGRLKTVLLQPQQQAVFALNTQELATKTIPVNVAKQEIWQPASLSFDDATLAEVAKRLEKTFNTTVTLANPALANCRLTVDFNQQRLAEILEQINKLLNTQYSLKDNLIVLTGEGCES